MGTLFNQPPRKQRYVSDQELDGFLETAVKLAKKHGVSVTDIVAAKQALELERQNTIFIDHGDAFDEQMAGMGELIQQIAGGIESISSRIEDLRQY